MVYRALPESCQREIDNEVGKVELSSYEGFMDFVINMSRHARYKSRARPGHSQQIWYPRNQARILRRCISTHIFS